MAEPRSYRSADLMAALDATSHDLRTWLSLEPFASRPKTRRVAVEYSAQDVLCLGVIQKLHKMGFAPKALQAFSANLFRALQRPVSTSADDVLDLYESSEGEWRVGSPPSEASSVTLTIPLRPLRQKLIQYSGAHLLSGQSELNLLTSIQSAGLRVAGDRRATR